MTFPVCASYNRVFGHGDGGPCRNCGGPLARHRLPGEPPPLATSPDVVVLAATKGTPVTARQAHYLLERIPPDRGGPILRTLGPYPTWEDARRVSREMQDEGREVYYADVSAGGLGVGLHVGRHPREVA